MRQVDQTGFELKTDEVVPTPKGGKPRVLVVEDRDEVRQATILSLGSRYDCEAPEDGIDFLYMLRGETRKDILVIVLDVELDTGWAIDDHSYPYIDDLQQLCPNAEILIYSGLTRDEVLKISEKYAEFDHVQKPNLLQLRAKTAALVAAALAN